jgi:prolyl-tRNA synthetase
MMRDGRALQSGTSHYLGTNFARAFGIQYTADTGEQQFCHTSSWGMSARMIGGVIMTHGDDKGLVHAAPDVLSAELTAFQDLLLRRATGFRDSRTTTVDAWEEFAEAVTAGWALAFHCGQAQCENDIKAATSATARVIPASGPPEAGVCVRCGLSSAYGKRLIFGRSY